MVIQTTLFISATLTNFVYTSHLDNFLFIPVNRFLFIFHTSAPVEVSVWLGGRSLYSDYGAVYD